MAVKAPLKAPQPPVYTWTGCYLGGNLGGGWAHKEFHFDTENEGTLDASGFVGGGQIGCDYQLAPNFVIGAQGMFDGASIKGTDEDPNDDGDFYPTTLHWFATATARVGFLASPSLLIYAKGGAAWVRDSYVYKLNEDTADVTRSGWDAGGGLEWMFAPGWSAFVEYDHMDFGSKDIFLAPVSSGSGFTENIKQTVDKALVGVNWRLNWGRY